MTLKFNVQVGNKTETVDAVKKLSCDVGIPADLKEIVDPADIQFLAESAVADACSPGNPKSATLEDIIGLYDPNDSVSSEFYCSLLESDIKNIVYKDLSKVDKDKIPLYLKARRRAERFF